MNLLFFIYLAAWAGNNLELMSDEGLHYVSPFLRFQENAISFADEAKWPAACDGENNRIESKLANNGMRGFQLFVSSECNLLITKLKNKKAANNISMVPMRISNPIGLKFGHGEIPSFPLENPRLQKNGSQRSQAPCLNNPEELERQIKETATKIADDSSLVPLTGTDGKIYYLKITINEDPHLNDSIRTELAKAFDSKTSNKVSSIERSQMSGISSEVALNMSGNFTNNSSCSTEQVQGSVANQYCGAMLTNGVRIFLENKAGVASPLAQAIGSSLFIPRNLLLYNKKPELGDIGVINLNIYNEAGDQLGQKVLGTVFGDGSFYLVWQKKI